MTYSSPLLIDEIASEIEDFLTKGCVIPFVGSLPALLKSSFGVAQTLAASTTLILSIPYSFTSFGQQMFLHSLRHIMHGIANIVSGLLLAIPLVGSVLTIPVLLKDLANLGCQVSYKNEQSHKFFAYKTIEDSTWYRSDLIGGYDGPVCPEDDKSDGLEYKAWFSL